MRLSPVWVCFALIAISCVATSEGSGDLPDSAQGVASPSTGSSVTTVTAKPATTSPTEPAGPQLPACAADVDEGGAQSLSELQFAFAGTVVAVDQEINSRSAFEMPWVTFEVERWYTNDWGTEFNVWAPTVGLTPGQTVIVGGDAYYAEVGTYAGQSGQVEVCVADSDAGARAWDEHFDGSVIAGLHRPEGKANPAVVASIETAHLHWSEVKPASYSYMFSYWDRHDPLERCTQGGVRVVVVEGAVTEAVGVADGCRARADSIPAINDVYARAVDLAGATFFGVTLPDADLGDFDFFAGDRSVEVTASISGISSNTSATVTGWHAMEVVTSQRRTQWDSSAKSYQIEISTGGGERSEHHVLAGVQDGHVIDLILNGDPVDPGQERDVWNPVTVDDVFALVDEMSGEGNVVAVFDPITGAPSEIWFDPLVDYIDDELYLRVELEIS